MGRILVTGAAGFIGSHLVDRLLELGHEVTGLDCFTGYYFRDLKQRNLDRALSHGRVRFFEGDLSRSNLDKIIDGVDKVAHLAGEPGVRSSWGERFSVYVERNVQATQRLLEAVSCVGLEQFVLASSSSVYGPDNGEPVAEDDPRKPPPLTVSPSSPLKSSSGFTPENTRCRRRSSATSRCMGRDSGRRWPSRGSSPWPRAGSRSKSLGTVPRAGS